MAMAMAMEEQAAGTVAQVALAATEAEDSADPSRVQQIAAAARVPREDGWINKVKMTVLIVISVFKIVAIILLIFSSHLDDVNGKTDLALYGAISFAIAEQVHMLYQWLVHISFRLDCHTLKLIQIPIIITWTMIFGIIYLVMAIDNDDLKVKLLQGLSGEILIAVVGLLGI